MNLLPALALLTLTTPAVQDGMDDDLPDGDKLVQVALLADHEAVAPGGTLTLGVRLTVEPKWHIYWQNPGDSGIPTKVQVTAPAGWEVGEVRFPWPERREDPGDIVTFVHEGEVVLLVDAKAPADAKPGATAAFAVEASWLVCTDLCVPGSGRASLEVAVADAARPANAKAFEAARARLPRPWSELPGARVAWAGEEATPRLNLVVPGAQALELFPFDVRPTRLESRTVDAGKSGASLKASLEFRRKKEGDAPRMHGVLWVRTAQGEAAYVIDTTYAAAGAR